MRGSEERDEFRLAVRAGLDEYPRKVGRPELSVSPYFRAASRTVRPSVNAVAKDTSDCVKSKRPQAGPLPRRAVTSIVVYGLIRTLAR
jgi:hypothetical protein